MKEQLMQTNESRLMFSSRSLTGVEKKTYAESRQYMADLSVETEVKSSGLEDSKLSEQKAKATVANLDALVQDISDKLTKKDKELQSLPRIEAEYKKISTTIQNARKIIPKEYREEKIKPAKKIQRQLRNLLLIKRSEVKYQVKVDEAAKKGIKLDPPPANGEAFISKWQRRFTGEEWGDREIREASEALAKKGVNPDGEERFDRATKVLAQKNKERGVDNEVILTIEQEEAIWVAHEVGKGEKGKDGKEGSAGIGNFTQEHIQEKTEILRGEDSSKELFTLDERRALIEAGIVGDNGGDGPGPGPGGEQGAVPEEEGDTEKKDQHETDKSSIDQRLRQLVQQFKNEHGVSPDANAMQALRIIAQGNLENKRPQNHTSHNAPDLENDFDSDEFKEKFVDSDGNEIPKNESLMNQEKKYLSARRKNVERWTDSHEGRLIEGAVESDMYGRKVNCVEVLALEIMEYEENPDYQIGGKYALLREVPGEKDALGEPRLEFQPENFMHWVRDWMMYWHSESPDQEWDFGKQIGVKRDYSPILLDAMINNEGRFFRSWRETEVLDENDKVVKDEKGEVKMENKVYKELVTQIKKELWLFGSSRSSDIKYKLMMGSDEKLPQTIQELFYLNTFTKSVWEGKSGLFHIMSLPEFFKEEEGDVKGDMRLGQALSLANQAYYHIADREKLEEILGKDAALLNGEKILEKLQFIADENHIEWYADDPAKEGVETFVDPELIKNIKNDPAQVMKFINIFDTQGTSSRVSYAVKLLIRDSINDLLSKGDKEKRLDDVNIAYAETFALSMARWSGAAARNDTDATGYDAWTRVQVTEEYRKKQLERKRGGAFGNPYTVNNLKQLGVDLFNGIQVQSMAKGDDEKLRAKSALEVFEEMANAKDEAEYHKATAQLVFGENVMRGFANDHMMRAFTMFQQVSGSEEIDFSKFTHFDALRGVTFDRAAFEEALKEKFFKPMRYGYSTFPHIDFGKVIRADVGKGKKPDFKDLHLGEAMFGREIIEGLGHDFFVHGKEHISMKDDNWSEKIDWNLIGSSKGKEAIWRQVALSRLSSQLYAHKDRHSTDPAYNWWYYNEIIESLEAIPNEILGDETDMQSSKAAGHFFTHHDIEWLRERSRTEAWRLYRNALISDVWHGSTKGFKESLKKFFEGVTKS